MKPGYLYHIKSFFKDLRRFNTREDIAKPWYDVKYWAKTLYKGAEIFVERDYFSKDVPALTYSTLTSFVPLMAFLFVIVRGFGTDDIFMTWVTQVFEGQPVVAEKLIKFAKNYLANTSSYTIVLVGLGSMAFTLYSLMRKIEMSVNSIWNVKGRGLWQMVRDYIIIFASFGFIIIVSSALNIIMLNVGRVMDGIYFLDRIAPIVLYCIAILPMACFFMFVFWFIPKSRIKFKNIIIPSFFTSILMFMMQNIYIRCQVYLTSYNIIYGSFAALPLLLLWMYYTWAICLFGFIICYVNQNLELYDGDIIYEEIPFYKRVLLCASILNLICKRHKNNVHAYNADDLQKEVKIPLQIIYSVIDSLTAVNLIEKVCIEEDKVGKESYYYSPTTDTCNITFGKLVEKLLHKGSKKKIGNVKYESDGWKKIKVLYLKYISEIEDIKLTDF